MQKFLSVFLLCGTALAAEITADSDVPTPGDISTTEPAPPPVDAVDTEPEASAPYPFVRIYSYAEQFSDLTPDNHFYENISALYEYGLSVGKKDGTYGIQDRATVGQGIIFAGRIRSLYDHGDAEVGAAPFRADGQHTYEAYLLYLQSLELLGTHTDSHYARGILRAHQSGFGVIGIRLPGIHSGCE